MNIPESSRRGSYLSFRTPLNSETSRTFNSHGSSVAYRSPLGSQNSQGMVNAAPCSYDQDIPVIYVQNPDKFERNNNRNLSETGTTSSRSSLRIPLFRCQDQTHSNSVLENENQVDYNIRKFKERSKSLSLPTKCFMVPKLEVKNRLMSEQHLPYVMESEWGDNRKCINNASFRDDIRHNAVRSSSYREKGYSRKPSVSRRPQLEALPEIDQSESISSTENQILKEIFITVPENDIYGSNEQNCFKENLDKLPNQNPPTLLRKVHNIEHENLSTCFQESNDMAEHIDSNSDNANTLCENSLLELDKNHDQNIRLHSAQSEVMLCKYGKKQAARSLSFQENFPKQTSAPNRVMGSLPENYCNKRSKHNVIQVDERNASLNMLRNYDMPDSVFDETHHQQYGYKEKDIHCLLAEERCAREEPSSELYQGSGNISYIVPKMKTSASQLSELGQLNNYKRTSSQDSINSVHLLPNKATASLQFTDEVNSKVYQTPYEEPMNSHQMYPRNNIADKTFAVSERRRDPRRSNSYTHGRSLNIQVQDLMDNTAYVSNAFPRYPVGALDASRQNLYGCYQIGDRNSVYNIPCMSRSFSQPQMVDMKNVSYMFEMTRNTSYLHEMNFSTSYIPDSSQMYDGKYDTYQGRQESRYSVSVDINNNTDDNPSMMYRDFFPDQSGVVVLEEGESMV